MRDRTKFAFADMTQARHVVDDLIAVNAGLRAERDAIARAYHRINMDARSEAYRDALGYGVGVVIMRPSGEEERVHPDNVLLRGVEGVPMGRVWEAEKA